MRGTVAILIAIFLWTPSAQATEPSQSVADFLTRFAGARAEYLRYWRPENGDQAARLDAKMALGKIDAAITMARRSLTYLPTDAPPELIAAVEDYCVKQLELESELQKSVTDANMDMLGKALAKAFSLVDDYQQGNFGPIAEGLTDVQKEGLRLMKKRGQFAVAANVRILEIDREFRRSWNKLAKSMQLPSELYPLRTNPPGWTDALEESHGEPDWDATVRCLQKLNRIHSAYLHSIAQGTSRAEAASRKRDALLPVNLRGVDGQIAFAVEVCRTAMPEFVAWWHARHPNEELLKRYTAMEKVADRLSLFQSLLGVRKKPSKEPQLATGGLGRFRALRWKGVLLGLAERFPDQAQSLASASFDTLAYSPYAERQGTWGLEFTVPPPLARRVATKAFELFSQAASIAEMRKKYDVTFRGFQIVTLEAVHEGDVFRFALGRDKVEVHETEKVRTLGDARRSRRAFLQFPIAREVACATGFDQVETSAKKMDGERLADFQDSMQLLRVRCVPPNKSRVARLMSCELPPALQDSIFPHVYAAHLAVMEEWNNRRNYRTFKDASGRFTIEARLQSIAKDAVVLEKRDRTTIQLPKDKLSYEDQRWLQDMFPDAK